MNEMYSNRQLNQLAEKNRNDTNQRATICILSQLQDRRDVLNIQTYVLGEMTEFSKVDLIQKNIQCKFIVYVTIVLEFQHRLSKIIRYPQNYSNPEQNEYFKSQENRILTFLKKHLIVECGHSTVNYAQQQEYYRQRREIQNQKEQNEQYSQQQNDQQDQDEQDDDDQLMFTCKKLTNSSDSKSITFKISGKFKCIFRLQNFLFPYYYINSGLKITVRRQYLNEYTFNYVIQSFKEKQILGNQFSLTCHAQSKFGIYQINWDSSTFGADYSLILQQSQFLNERLRDSYQEISRKKESIRSVLFKFQIFSYNIPFIFRHLVPIIVLSFASLMVYLADSTQIANIYANVILIAITLVQQISNFRQSQYTGTRITFYETHIIGQIAINFLLMIITTSNNYRRDLPSQTDRKTLNSESVIFWVSVGIATVFVLFCFAYLAYFFYKSKTIYSKAITPAQLRRNPLIWNEQTSGNIANFLDIQCRY